jgi:uncharacterized protein (TIGR02186 family)
VRGRAWPRGLPLLALALALLLPPPALAQGVAPGPAPQSAPLSPAPQGALADPVPQGAPASPDPATPLTQLLPPPLPAPPPAPAPLPGPAPATPGAADLPASVADLARPALVAELSQTRIEITTGFTGTELLVFGATDRLIGAQFGTGAGDDVLVIAQNEPEPMVVRRKTRVLGFWINGPSARFRSVPGFYALTGTRALSDMLSADERSGKRLGLDSLPLESTGVQDPAYRQALLRLKRDAQLWQEQETPLQVAGSRLFSARLHLPATVQTGDYQVQVLLVREGRVLARQELSFRVERVGTAARIADVAEQQPLVYGMICILLAAFAGWMGSVLFRRS